MKLVVGLGNPGRLYRNTWHNLGFEAVEIFGRSLTGARFKTEKTLNAEIATAKIGSEKIILMRPLTFMNQSGLAVAAASQYFKINAPDIIVVRDDLDLPLGKIRLAQNSSAGGHNGLKSITENLKTKNFIQIKLGCATPRQEKIGASDYVLAKIKINEKSAAKKMAQQAAAAIEMIISHGPEAAMNKYN